MIFKYCLAGSTFPLKYKNLIRKSQYISSPAHAGKTHGISKNELCEELRILLQRLQRKCFSMNSRSLALAVVTLVFAFRIRLFIW